MPTCPRCGAHLTREEIDALYAARPKKTPGPPLEQQFADLTGQRFGRLTARRHVGTHRRETYSTALWECLCDCGRSTVAQARKLQSGAKKSCGCLRRVQ